MVKAADKYHTFIPKFAYVVYLVYTEKYIPLIRNPIGTAC